MALPLNIRDLLNSSAKYTAEREKPVRIAVIIDAQADDRAIGALKEALRPHTGFAMLHVEVVAPGEVVDVESSGDVVIALAGPGSTLEESLRRSRERFIPTVVLALEDGRETVARRLSHPLLDTVVDSQTDGLVEKLGKWLSERVEGKRVSMAANFAFVRRAVAEEAVKSTSFQNLIIGGVAIIPGADMPLMTANQAKMIMQIAAAYGQPLGAERVKEIASVVGGAFVLRTVARQFVALVPGFGWAIKAGIGYTGTLAMGYAAVEYFEGGGDIAGLGAKLRDTREKVMRAAAKRRGQEREVIEAHAWVAEDASGDVSAHTAGALASAEPVPPSEEDAVRP